MNVPVVVQIARIITVLMATLGPGGPVPQRQSHQVGAHPSRRRVDPDPAQHDVDEPVGLVEPDRLDDARHQRRQQHVDDAGGARRGRRR